MQESDKARQIGRPRCEATHRAILAATRQLFSQSNLRDLTIESIAKEAGVGKATIYRWWKTKAELVMDACLDDLLPQLQFGSSGDPAILIADQIVRVIKAYRGPSGRMVSQVLAEAQYDPAIADQFCEKYFTRRGGTLHELLHKCGITRECEQNLLAEQFYGPIFFRLIMQHAPLDDEFSNAIRENVIERLRAARQEAA